MTKWEVTSFDAFGQLALRPDVPVEISELLWLSRGEMDVDPAWLRSTPYLDARRAYEHELPHGYLGGLVMRVPCIEAPSYLEWLLGEFSALGGKALFGYEVQAFEDLDAEVIVNCAGLGAAHLVNDASVKPVRGQVAYVRSSRPLRRMFSETETGGLTYVFPRPDVTVIGGTAEAEDVDPHVRSATTELILERARALQPDIAHASLVGAAVGFRPSRHTVHLDVQDLDRRKAVVHNYGHGGHGFTFSWGCAAEVADLVCNLGTNAR